MKQNNVNKIINYDDNFLGIEPEEISEEECASCGTLPFIDGVTEGCYDENGCGRCILDLENKDDEPEEQDEEISELDFG